MALDSADLEALSNAIQSAITAGFASAFPPPGGAGGGGPSPSAGRSGPAPTPSPTSASASATTAATTPPPKVTPSLTSTAGGPAYIGASTSITEAFASGVATSKDVLEAALKEIVDLQGGLYVKGYRDLIQDFGGEIRKIGQEDFIRGDFSKIMNKGSEAAIRSFRDMAIGYAKEINKFEGLSLEEQESNRKEFIKSFGDFNSNLLLQSNKNLEKNLQIFKTSMGLSAKEAAELIQVSFAETGKASDEILTQIVNNAKAVGKAVGVPTNVMAEGIREVKTDMYTFTDITVAGAARMVGSLSQVGLTLESFKRILGDYRGFDSAAEKLGDLSATFGIQMDAMEMMYLANEDEEQFLHRLRDQILDQGIDIESMSKTRQRALADQMGMTMQEMKMFMITGSRDIAAQSDLQAATQEASTKTQVDAMKTLEEGLVATAKTLERSKAEVQELQSAFSSINISNFTESVAESEGEIQKFLTTGNRLAAAIKDTQNNISGLTAALGQGFSEALKAINPSNSNAETDASWASFGSNFIQKATSAAGAMRDGTIDGLQKAGLIPNSWPEAFAGLANALGADVSGAPNDQMTFYQDTITRWGQTLSDAIQTALESVNASFDFSELTTNFQQAANIVNEGVGALSGISTAPPAAKVAAPASVADNKALNSVAESIKSISQKIESMPTEVNVKVDIESIKKDIVSAINTGFTDANYGFNMMIDGQKIATVLSKASTLDGKTFQMVSSS